MTFSLIDQHYLIDLDCQGYLYEHQETGAQVFYIKNDDPNKAFTIGFKTPPYSDNGICHIIEHSVLNGSVKYPSKEPFVELIKGSLNTFVNAMTFDDKTIYPVASTNEADFNNLMSVYLDAVFEPNFRTDPQVLAQEGWHYHLESAEDNLIYKGVVFNEMKGALASAEQQLNRKINQALYPNTIYAFESGGTPAAIPSLTQEEFVDFHKKYYHPSNSLTMLYGDLNIEQSFDLLGEYFDRYEKQSEKVDLRIKLADQSVKEVVSDYSIAGKDDPQNKDYLSLAWHVSQAEDVIELATLEVLEQILLGNQEAPLKKALLDSGLVGDVIGGLDFSGYVQSFSVTGKYAKAENMPAFKELVYKVLSDLVIQKIDPELIEAALNRFDFFIKERAISESNPRGVIYAISSYQTWLYGQSPYSVFESSLLLEEIRQKAKEGYLEAFIQEKFLNNSHRVEAILNANPGKSDREEEEVFQKLQDYKASLTKDQIQELVANTQSLIERQASPDKPEDLLKIPTLTKEDLSTSVQETPLKKSSIAFGQSSYQIDLYTAGIDYLTYFWDLSDLDLDFYSDLSFLASLLTQLSTKNYSTSELRKQIDIYMGGISAGLRVYQDENGRPLPYFTLQAKGLKIYRQYLIDLMSEVMLTSVIEDKNQLLKVINQSISRFQMTINYQANALALNRALSQFHPVKKLQEAIAGIDYYNYLKNLKIQLEGKDWRKVIERLQDVYLQLLNKKRFSYLFLGPASDQEDIEGQIEKSLQEIKSLELANAVNYPCGESLNEAFVTAQDVNYVALASKTPDSNDFTGANHVLANELNYGYLWNEVRVKGGAYGAGFQDNRFGQIGFYSYRDPNIERTLAIYKATPDYVANLNLSQEALLKDIIGTISQLEAPKSPIDRAYSALALALSGRDWEDLRQLKKEIINCQLDDLKSLYNALNTSLKEARTVVIGNDPAIHATKDHFDVIRDLY